MYRLCAGAAASSLSENVTSPKTPSSPSSSFVGLAEHLGLDNTKFHSSPTTSTSSFLHSLANASSSSSSYATDFHSTTQALSAVGIGPSAQQSSFRLVAAILHLEIIQKRDVAWIEEGDAAPTRGRSLGYPLQKTKSQKETEE